MGEISLLPEPILETHHGVVVVRDDLLPGGTKRRVVPLFFTPEHDEYVYAGPVYGYAQWALAEAARDYGKRATLFVAMRSKRHPLTERAAVAGATIQEIRYGYLSTVRRAALDYTSGNDRARLLPFGLHDDGVISKIGEIARALPVTPDVVWSVAGSGTLQLGLQQAWPEAEFHAVIVGNRSLDCGKAKWHIHPLPFERNVPKRDRPPFPSSPNYDAKAWSYVVSHRAPAGKTVLFWNVGA
jgi:hypothetical protein